MNLTYTQLKMLGERYAQSFYLLDTRQFRQNFRELTKAFRTWYPKMQIAYSYKTNYIPHLCSIVEEEGGLAEVVSHMEYEITKRLGIPADHVVFNGPWKDTNAMEEIILAGGKVNLDSLYDFEILKDIAARHPLEKLGAGIRCNFEISDGVISRFGFDVKSQEFAQVLTFFRETPNVFLRGLHCHFAARGLAGWPARVRGMLQLLEQENLAEQVEYVDLGGGLFGKMPNSLKAQFDSTIPTYEEYAQAAAKPFADFYEGRTCRPTLLVEPGSALVGDVMKFAAPIISIKTVRNKAIATVLGSIYNINPTLNKKNPPLEILSETQRAQYEDLDFGGFTCIESDYLFRHYSGPAAVGDYAVFGNVGSYSVVLKPPFILPNFPVLELKEDGTAEEIKRAENFDDLFHTYRFDFEK